MVSSGLRQRPQSGMGLLECPGAEQGLKRPVLVGGQSSHEQELCVT